MSALIAHDLVRTLGERRVLDGISLTASPGHRIGLIGENGVGKSTLLRVLAGVDDPDAGSVTRPADLGFLHQEMPYDSDATIAAVLDEALREAREDLAELDRLGEELARTPEDQALLDAYGRRLERAQDRESWDADRRAALVLDGLGLGAFGHNRTLGSLSGGQRGRLSLAALLVRHPSALLLDEPTNHLDDGAAALDGLEVSPTDRLLVTGGNGAGKSTLLAVLAGRLPAEGEVIRRRRLTVGLLTQDTVFERSDRTVRDTYELALGIRRAEMVPLGSLGLLSEADLDKPVGQLSVGQRRRLALALLVARPPQLLLLDEPTNHLSPALCDELEAALGPGPGAIVVASHDRWLRRRWQGREHRLKR